MEYSSFHIVPVSVIRTVTFRQGKDLTKNRIVTADYEVRIGSALEDATLWWIANGDEEIKALKRYAQNIYKHIKK